MVVYCVFTQIQTHVHTGLHFDAGYVLELQVGNQILSGEEFRYALNLPSACFKIAFEGKQVWLTVYGQGNGLGFDQYGANRQAKEGKNYEQLLEYYLTGVKVGE